MKVSELTMSFIVHLFTLVGSLRLYGKILAIQLERRIMQKNLHK